MKIIYNTVFTVSDFQIQKIILTLSTDVRVQSIDYQGSGIRTIIIVPKSTNSLNDNFALGVTLGQMLSTPFDY